MVELFAWNITVSFSFRYSVFLSINLYVSSPVVLLQLITNTAISLAGVGKTEIRAKRIRQYQSQAASNLIGLTLHCTLHWDVAKGRGERPIRPCRLFDWYFSHVFLKHNDSVLNLDFMHRFHMKMSLLGLCTLFSKVTLYSLLEVFCGPQICQKFLWRPGLRPGPRWGISRRSPHPLVGWGGGYPAPIPIPLRATILGPSERSASPPQYKILATLLDSNNNGQ